MKALTFLRPGRVAPFTGVTWPPPGQWLASAAPPALCRAGVHALLADSLATWTAEELWRVELDGAWELAPGGFAAERRWQSRWLADRLGVPGNSRPPS
jgi:hypothetical protein